MDTVRENIKQRRIQFDFTPEALKRLEDLKDKIEAPTKAEVIRNALKLYDWFVGEIKEDYVLEVKDSQGNIMFKIPAKVLLS